MNSSDIEQVVGAAVASVMGDLLDGDVLGVSRGRGARVRLPPKPPWRQGQIATGVHLPREGMQPLPLEPDLASGIFVAGGPSVITFKARPQKPFQGLRLLAQVLKTGTTGIANFAVAQNILIGTSPQSAAIADMNLEFFAATAFGVELSMVPAEAGIDVKVPVVLVGPALAGTDTVAVQIMILGHTID